MRKRIIEKQISQQITHYTAKRRRKKEIKNCRKSTKHRNFVFFVGFTLSASCNVCAFVCLLLLSTCRFSYLNKYFAGHFFGTKIGKNAVQEAQTRRTTQKCVKHINKCGFLMQSEPMQGYDNTKHIFFFIYSISTESISNRKKVENDKFIYFHSLPSEQYLKWLKSYLILSDGVESRRHLEYGFMRIVWNWFRLSCQFISG